MKHYINLTTNFILSAVLMIMLFLPETNFSQSSSKIPQNIYEIKFRNRSFTPQKISTVSKEAFANKHNLILQMDELLSPEKLSELKNAGILVHGKTSPTSLSVFIDDLNKLDNIKGLRWIGSIEPNDKISKRTKELESEFFVVAALHHGLNKVKYEQDIINTGAEIKFNPYLPNNFFLLKVNKQVLNSVAGLDEISYIYPASERVISGEKIFYCPGNITAYGYTPEYVTNGQGWDGPGKGSASLNYHFVNGTPDASGEAAEVVAALLLWSQYASINWTQTSTAGLGKTIEISWGSDEHGDGFPFDGPGGVLAHCFYPDDINPEPLAGDLHFDEDEFWRVGDDKDVFSVALHEAGHGLGLNHSDDVNAIMYPFYGGAVADLRDDDIQGIRSLYATVNTPRASPPVFDPVSGTYPSPIEVRLQYGAGTNFNNSQIKYTIDGSEPHAYSYSFIPDFGDYLFQRYSNTVKARTFRQGHLPSEVVSASYVLQQSNPTVANPVITPAGGTYDGSVSVSMSSETDFSVIRYTTDGSEPTEASFAYAGPINIIQSSVVKAKAFRTNYTPSQTVSADYNIITDVSTPQFYPANGGVFSQAVSVTVFSETPGAQIYYTTNGSEPTTSSSLYINPVLISTTTLLKAKAFLGQNSSGTASATFNISVTLPPPTIFPNGGEFDSSVTVYMGSTVLSAVIRYTTNGAEPTSYSTQYENPINLGIGEHTVKAKVFLPGYTPSNVEEAAFTVFDPNPVFVADPVVWPRSTQTFTVPIPLEMSCTTEGAVIRYTVGFGQLPPDPTATGGGSITYNGPVNLGAPGQNMFLKVRAFKTGMNPSAIIQTGQLSVVAPLGAVETPVFDPPAGVYNNSVQVSITSTTQFAQVIYTKDGTEPDTFFPITFPSAVYNNPINIFKSSTYKAKGRRTFFSDSETATAEYLLLCGVPVITPDSGSYTDTVSVSMTTITNNAKIYYSLDGSEPTDSSFKYEGPILLTPGSYVIKAKTFKFGFEESQTSIAEINVNVQSTLPTITTQPQDVTANVGETATMFVEASGTPAPTYQWIRNGVPLAQETDDTLRFENVQVGDGGMYSVKVTNSAGTVTSSIVDLTINPLTSVDEIVLAGIPNEYKLYGNYPNPFNPSTKIKYGIPEASKVTISIYNVIGENVITLTDEVKNAGYYEKIWNAGNLASGVYFLKINASSTLSGNKFSSIHKLLLLK